MFKRFFKKYGFNQYLFTALKPLLSIFIIVLLEFYCLKTTMQTITGTIKIGCVIMSYLSIIRAIESKDIQEVRFITLSLFGLISLLVTIH